MKMILPHFALTGLLFAYLMVGAWAFSRLEVNAEAIQRQQRVAEIQNIYRRISRNLHQICPIFADQQLYDSLSRLSSFMEGKTFILSPNSEADVSKLLPSKWDPMSSILYALSILTTTGYGYVSPITAAGKYLSMAYGFVGIPLMFLAAVDIGRFLSDVVLRSYARIQKTQKRIAEFFGCLQKTAIISHKVETTALKVLTPIKRKRSIGRKNSSKRKKDHNGEETRLPLSVNASILLLFCMFGGLVYTAAGGDQKNFIGAFFVTFNLVANLTMAEMPTDISRILTVFYITIFVTFGLAVLSMCAELAAGELKWVFLKIHYFGRKINWKRKCAQKPDQMDVEVKELLSIINQIRRKHPEKREITSEDILTYVQEMNGGQPYVTLNMLLRQHRRDTIAFMPQSIEALKFADDMDELSLSSYEEESEDSTQSSQMALRFPAVPYDV